MITTTTLSVRGSHRRKNSFIKSLSSSVYEQSVNIDWILHWRKETVEIIWPVSACLCLSVCPLFNWQGQSRDLVGLYLSGGPAWCQSCYLIKISDVFTLPLVSKKIPLLSVGCETGAGWWLGTARPDEIILRWWRWAEILPTDKWEEMLLK